MKETVISWTFVNWVTIVLMFVSAMIVVGLGARVFTSMKQGQNG